MLGIAQKALRKPPIPFRATLFEKSGEKNWLIAWHQDTALPLESRADAPGRGPWSEKAGVVYAHAPAAALSRIIALRLHLDDSTEKNGPLRVIPNSHRGLVDSDEEIMKIASCTPAVICTVPKGGVLAMRPLLIHASSKTLSDALRRVLHIEYADGPDLTLGIRLAIA